MLVSRRHVIGALAGAPLACLSRPFVAPAADMPAIDGARLRAHLEALSVFGRPADGGFEAGVSRVAYSDADVQGRAFVLGLIKDLGLRPRIDAAGNVFATRTGKRSDLPPILFGSHIDSVPGGGNFDGDLGVLSSIEVVRALADRSLVTDHPLEVVIWAHEEGGTFPNGLNGSRAAAGRSIPGELDEIWNGLTKADGIRRIGGHPERIADARRASGSFHCYIELHIEQGGTLEQKAVPIGIVEGIVAIHRHSARIVGTANHAGTTPMANRQDALLAASHLVIAVREVVTRLPGRQVGTVGHIDVKPNAANVVPGEVLLSIEFRDLAETTLERLAQDLSGEAARIGRETRTTIELQRVGGYAGAGADAGVQGAVGRAAERLGAAHIGLPSGAGHDAQMMATLGPMGMIFVPSAGGVSHSPKEWTSWDDCARGANVLLGAVLEADRVRF